MLSCKYMIKNIKKGNISTILLFVAVVIIISLLFYINKLKNENLNINQENKENEINTNIINTSTSSIKTQLKNIDVQSNLVEKAVGFIKKVYTKNDRNYIDIDYIIIENCMKTKPNDCPNGISYKNDNPLIRTFELSPNLIINIQGGAESINYSDFVKIMQDKEDYRSLNPWGIVVKNGLIVEMNEVFLP